MKPIDMARMALGNLRRRALMPLAVLITGTVCLCCAGAIGVSVGAEKQTPCELTVTAPNDGSITGQTVADIAQIPDVIGATAILPVQVTLVSGWYTAAITLLGIDGRYLEGPYETGGVFPDNAVMPYIVLTRTGETSFVNPEDPPSPADTDYAPDVDWPNAPIALYLGGDADTKPVASRVCGILAGDTQDAAGYIDIATAKTLLRDSQSTDITTAVVRVKNSGVAKAVTREINALGYNASAPNIQLQAKWDGQVKEMTYLSWMGGLCLLCATLLLTAVLDTGAAARRDDQNMLRWMGMRGVMIRRICVWQSAMIGAAGAISGILIRCLIPAFIPVEQRAASSFALPLPPLMVLSVGVLCIGIYVLSGIMAAKKQREFRR